MRISNSRRLLASASAGLVVAALAAAPTALAQSTGTDQAAPAKVSNRKVIVLLKDQHLGLAPKRGAGRSTQRAHALAADQVPVVNIAHQLGATHLHQFSLINAVSATISSDKLAALSRDPAVRAIVPDLPIRRADMPSETGGASTTPRAAGGDSIPQSSYCNTNSASPRLEPEGLQAMHVAYDDPTTPSASQLADGSGVTVGWLADGIDINNPDFIRANGDHVFTDYKDFSGDGLNAPSPAGEAFGDASSIAAQGLHTYNTNLFAAAANQQPGGCFIRIRGVAPGANMVGLNVFGTGDTASTSGFVQAVDYAVDTDGVDVLNESLGNDPYPDGMDDPLALADKAAIAAGVTVVASTGDSGTNGTIGSPSTLPKVIAVGATDTFRTTAELRLDGLTNPALNVNGWVNGNIPAFSSGGYAQSGKVPDVVAPGNSGWALCSTDTTTYEECTNLDGTSGAPIEDFGGTSESSPLTAGTAALVIEAYRQAHHGASPSPALVKSIIVGTAHDLGHPAFEQGAGEVNALAAVRAALSIPAPGSHTEPATATGAQLVTSTSTPGLDQLDLTRNSGSTTSGKFTVQNASVGTQTVSLSTRSLTKKLSTQSGSLTLDPNQTFPNVQGAPRPYKIVDVPVPAGADRLDASFVFDTQQFSVFAALVDPFGNFEAYSDLQGPSNFAHMDARYPAPGTWQVMVWASPGFTGKIRYQFTTSRYATYGTVHPSTLTLAPGAKASVTANFPASTRAGDMSAAVVMKTQRGEDASMAVSLRTLIPNKPNSSFSGVITGGNGRGSDALSQTYYLRVPNGEPALTVSTILTRKGNPNELTEALLVDPNGNTQSTRTNIIVNKHGNLDVGRKMLTFVRAPQPGLWHYVLMASTPTGGQVINQPFTGKVHYQTQSIAPVTSLPHNSTKLTRGTTYKYKVAIKNTNTIQQVYFADPRLNKKTHYDLASQAPGNDLQNVPLPVPNAGPVWLVPTETTAMDAYVNASLPVDLDFYWAPGFIFGSPDTFGASNGNSTSVQVAASPAVPNGDWEGDVSEVGPFITRAPSGHFAENVVATTSAFDFDADSSTGDFWFTSLIPAAGSPTANATGPSALGSHGRYLNELRRQARTTPVATTSAKTVPGCGSGPVILDPGQSCTITFTITPAAAHGAKVRGHLSIQALDPLGGTTSDLISLPYGYQVK
ncbi:MAG TPA: S8 family serine peptidase [Jatrophihabitantaceae bacterium]|nr:S8 family serine peptidase [Jatrophihabitantaceae bacterium]